MPMKQSLPGIFIKNPKYFPKILVIHQVTEYFQEYVKSQACLVPIKDNLAEA